MPQIEHVAETVPAESDSSANHKLPRRTRQIACRLIHMSLGLLLLAAAYLKFQDMTWEPFGKAVFIPPRLRMIFVETEAVLGVWLLTGLVRRSLWPVTIIYFAALAGVSAYLATHGVPTCGCFGKAPVSPWITFGFNLLAVAALAVTWPRSVDTSASARGSGSGRSIALWAAGGLGVVLIVQIVKFGGVAAAWESFAIQTVTAEPYLAEIGEEVAGTTVTIPVTLRNHSPSPVHVLGASISCDGNAAVDLPITIPPGEARTVQVRCRFKGPPGRFVREYAFFVSPEAGNYVTARFAGTILPPQ